MLALRPNDGQAPAAAAAAPTDDDRQPNNLVQSDDPLVVAMAREAAGDETDTWKLAKREGMESAAAPLSIRSAGGILRASQDTIAARSISRAGT